MKIRTVWPTVLALSIVLLLLAGYRQGCLGPGARDTPAVEAPEAMAQQALAALEADENILTPETEDMLRAAAVPVAAGRLQTPEGYYLLGMQYLREHNTAGAEALFKRAIALRPEWARPYAALGTLLARNAVGRVQEAQEALQHAIDLAPEWAKPRNTLAVLLRLEGHLEAAREHARTALQLEPGSVANHNNYANLLVELEEYEEAEHHYRAAIDLAPEHAKPYYNLACLYSIAGEYETALDYLADAFERADNIRLEARNNPDLAPLRDLPAFQALVGGEEER